MSGLLKRGSWITVQYEDYNLFGKINHVPQVPGELWEIDVFHAKTGLSFGVFAVNPYYSKFVGLQEESEPKWA